MTVGDALGEALERLRASGESGRFDAVRLLGSVLERNASWIFAHHDAALDDASAAAYRAAVARRAIGEPVPYVVGTAGFYGRTFRVSPSVLVPRPETEHLVILARLRYATGGETPRAICDVGTGSGILAITLALEWPQAAVVAIDSSPDALAIARENALAHGVAERIDFRTGDVLDALAPDERFDLLAANLPYVRTGDLAPSPDPTSFEPRLALDGGPDGLDVYRRFLARAPDALSVDGVALMEAGPDTTTELATLARAAFEPGARVTIYDDYGKRPRVVEVRRSVAES